MDAKGFVVPPGAAQH